MMQPFAGTAAEWNALIAGLPNAHLLQTWEWAQVKAKGGWEPMPFVWDGAAAMVLRRPVISRVFAARLCLVYIPKGPLFDPADARHRGTILDELQVFARRQGAIELKVDPDVVVGWGWPDLAASRQNEAGTSLESELRQRGWCFSGEQIQFRNTVTIDLNASEDELLERMKQKTRYNVRLAEKKGVHIRPGNAGDLSALYRMYAETSARDGFVIRTEAYYRMVWETFMSTPKDGTAPFAEPLVAEVDGEPVAAIFLFYFARRAYYLYGMSRAVHREKMPNYLLQWEAIKRARARGCTVYDLWGAPDALGESDALWGVYRFKEGLGGEVVRTLGAWDYPAHPIWYRTYTQLMPRLLARMRARGKAQTKRALE